LLRSHFGSSHFGSSHLASSSSCRPGRIVLAAMAPKAPSQRAADVARGTLLSLHAAVGMAQPCRSAARLLRAAEGHVRAAIEILVANAEVKPELPVGPPEAVARRRSRPRGKKGRSKAAQPMEIVADPDTSTPTAKGPAAAALAASSGATVAVEATPNDGGGSRGTQAERGAATLEAEDVGVDEGMGEDLEHAEPADEAAPDGGHDSSGDLHKLSAENQRLVVRMMQYQLGVWRSDPPADLGALEAELMNIVKTVRVVTST